MRLYVGDRVLPPKDQRHAAGGFGTLHLGEELQERRLEAALRRDAQRAARIDELHVAEVGPGDAERRVERGFANLFAARRRVVRREEGVQGLLRRLRGALEEIDELEEHRGRNGGTRVEPGLELRPRYAEQYPQPVLAADQDDGFSNERGMLGAGHEALATVHPESTMLGTGRTHAQG